MNRTLKLLLALIGLLGTACISPLVLAAPDTPSIIISETGFNFGELSETVPLSRDFVVKNGGGATLNIRDVRPS